MTINLCDYDNVNLTINTLLRIFLAVNDPSDMKRDYNTLVVAGVFEWFP
jgi:peptide methionine sulfoxide reductase MsrA